MAVGLIGLALLGADMASSTPPRVRGEGYGIGYGYCSFADGHGWGAGIGYGNGSGDCPTHTISDCGEEVGGWLWS